MRSRVDRRNITHTHTHDTHIKRYDTFYSLHNTPFERCFDFRFHFKCVAHSVARAQCLENVFFSAMHNFSFAFIWNLFFFPCNEVNCMSGFFFFFVVDVVGIATSATETNTHTQTQCTYHQYILHTNFVSLHCMHGSVQCTFRIEND